MDKEELQQQFLTIQEVCKTLNVTKACLWKWKNQNLLTPIKLGKLVRYKKEDIENILKNGGFKK